MKTIDHGLHALRFSLLLEMYRLILHGTILLFILAFYQTVAAQAPFQKALADSAFRLTLTKVHYDPAYYVLSYPNGDLPPNKGVCTDVVIRAYRMFQIDLQREVHLDIKENFSRYPKLWGLKKPDKNIDHRRVPNLMRFFARKGIEKPITLSALDYQPGDIVCWNLGGAITHIGLVSAVRSDKHQGYKIIHNIGRGQVIEDCLFDFKIIGHYLYPPLK
ncbi:MAG: DUF1287 domain-containing protein [Chloroherpetonaceae bacterium]|nr:DUF1287 domain-containing protein [Chloroherpetonaceae bacterium]